jgi:hypothetical protein
MELELRLAAPLPFASSRTRVRNDRTTPARPSRATARFTRSKGGGGWGVLRKNKQNIDGKSSTNGHFDKLMSFNASRMFVISCPS